MPERKKNAKPGVFRRGDSWSYRLSYVDEGTGKYRQKWVGGFRNQTEAWNAKLDAQNRRNAGDDMRPETVTVEAYLKRWLKDYASSLGETTHKGYESLFRLHVYPAIGAVRLRRLRPLQVQAIYTAMVQEKGLSKKTALNCHRALSRALKVAVGWEVATRNVATQAQAPKPDQFEPVIMPVALVREALAYAAGDDVQSAVVRFAIYSGMRQGEIRRMKRDAVNLELAYTSIPRAKSKAGRRNLAQTPEAMGVLKRQLAQRDDEKELLGPAYKDEGIVFARHDGSQLSAGACDWAWERIRRQLKTEARFHDLRHAHASLLLSLGVHPKVVQERLGHATIQITIDTYSHVMPGIHDAAVLPLDELLRPRSPGLGDPASLDHRTDQR